jgi:ankyrin repeat protein
MSWPRLVVLPLALSLVVRRVANRQNAIENEQMYAIDLDSSFEAPSIQRARRGDCDSSFSFFVLRSSTMGNLVSAQARTQKNLEQAALKGSVADAKYWVAQAGADPILMDASGWTAMHHACAAGHLSVVEYFVDSLRCSVHAPNVDRSTPLMLAVTAAPGCEALVAYLLRKGALPNEQQNEGLTALHLAAIMRVPSVVEMLRRHGASSSLRDDKDRLPRDLCDDDATRAAFDQHIVVATTAETSGFASASSSDGEDEPTATTPAATDAAVVSREHIEALCNQLHSTFANVSDLAALDEMIAFYAQELHTLKSRRRKISRNQRSTNVVNAAEQESVDDNDNDDDDDEDPDGGKEMLPLIDHK